ncbi:uncharacterized protein LOC141915122 [Tubulanus polymorphus]|uniref:uncharacterized protein LOC141915122 n=1 Tax=Tubulanus polymorphus TaxID=672921 RepID=UPI003DA27FCD
MDVYYSNSSADTENPLCLVVRTDSHTPKVRSWDYSTHTDQCSALDLSVKAKRISIDDENYSNSEISPRKCLLSDFLDVHQDTDTVDDESIHESSFISSVSTSRRNNRSWASPPSTGPVLNRSCGLYFPRPDSTIHPQPRPAHSSTFHTSHRSISRSTSLDQSYLSQYDASIYPDPIHSSTMRNSTLNQYDSDMCNSSYFRRPNPVHGANTPYTSKSPSNRNNTQSESMREPESIVDSNETNRSEEKFPIETSLPLPKKSRRSENLFVSPKITRSRSKKILEDSQSTSVDTSSDGAQKDHVCDDSTALENSMRTRPTRSRDKKIEYRIPDSSSERKKTQRKKRETSKNAMKETMKERTLKDWYIRPIPNMKAIMVEGILLQTNSQVNSYWKSTNIVTRIDSNTVKTSNGSLYKLHGKISRTLSIKNGFSSETVNSFKNGFPSNWKNLLAKHFESEESKKEKKKSNVSSVPQKKKSALQSQKKALDESFAQRKESGGFEYSLLPKTKSGRAVKPILNYWEGERVFIHPRTLSVQILNNSGIVSSSSPCDSPEVTEGRRKSKKMHQRPSSNKQTSNRNSGSSKRNHTISSTGERSANNTSESDDEPPSEPKKSPVRKTKKRKNISSNGKNPEKLIDDSSRSEDSNLIGNSKTTDLHKDSTLPARKKIRLSDKSFPGCLKHLESVVSISSSTTTIDKDSERVSRIAAEKSSKKDLSNKQWKKPLGNFNDSNVADGQDGHRSKGNEKSKNGRKTDQSKEPVLLKSPGGSVVTWKQDEIERLHKAITTVAPGQSFWEDVAENVATKSPDECVQFHFKDIPNMCHAKKKPPVKRVTTTGSDKSTTKKRLGGRGTLKRKRQLREFLEKEDEDYQDDFFDSTPLKSLLNTYKTSGLVDDNDSPVLPTVERTPFVPALKFIPVSERKTPAFHSPGLLNVSREWAEEYVHKVLKERKTNRHNKISDKSKTPARRNQYANVVNLPEPSKALFTVTEQDDDDEDEDSNEEKDYYWSDYENEDGNLNH